jgi:hypothetical protein
MLAALTAHNLPPQRVKFVKRVDLVSHLARLPLIDVMFDTDVVTGHTNSANALFAQVPPPPHSIFSRSRSPLSLLQTKASRRV